MAMIEVATLNEDCWRDCDDFAVEIEDCWSANKIYYRSIRCPHVNRCRKIGRMVEKSMKGVTDERETV